MTTPYQSGRPLSPCANCGQPLELVDLPNGTGLRYPAWFHVASGSTACTMPPRPTPSPDRTWRVAPAASTTSTRGGTSVRKMPDNACTSTTAQMGPCRREPTGLVGGRPFCSKHAVESACVIDLPVPAADDTRQHSITR